MKKIVAVLFCMFIALAGSNGIAQQKDRPGSKDHPLLTRMPDFFINVYEEKDFDRQEYYVAAGKRVPVEGHKIYIQYNLQQGAKGPGDLKVVRNIEDALKKIGGEVLYEGERPWNATVKLVKESRETWVSVWAYPTLYRLTIVEREVMKQEVTANAESMGNEINTTGHVSIYGIFFDTGKSDIKPESDVAIAEIAKLLKNTPALKLHVVGHTDNTGSFESNMTLSKDRAAAVMNQLTAKHGIESSRLLAYGVSSLSPVASNRTEEGKAKNRRVELVEQ